MKTILLIILMLVSSTVAQEIPPRIGGTFVQDHAQVLNPTDEAVIQQKLNEFKSKYNVEFGVATVNTTGDYPIFDYSLKMAREYGVGSKEGEHRGILLLLAIKDRKSFFQISNHMEGVITDGQAGDIARNALAPKLRIASKTGASADWRDGILAALNAVEVQVDNNIQPEQVEPTPQPSDNNYSIFGILTVIIGGVVLLWMRFYRKAVRRMDEEREQRILLYKRKLTPRWEPRLVDTERRHTYNPPRLTPRVSQEPVRSSSRHSIHVSEPPTRSSYSSSDNSSSSSSGSSSSSSYDSGSSFGGGSDFGGGGGGSDW